MITPPPRLDFSSGNRLSARGGGYSWFVRIAKLALPLTALVLIGIVVARLSDNPVKTAISTLPVEERTTPGMIELTQAKYEGTDSEGRPYTLTATKAERSAQEEETVLLHDPKADITLEDGSWIAVHAKAGLYNNKESSLTLEKGVQVYHDGGHEMHLEDIKIDLATRHAASDKPVRAQSPLGELEAASLKIEDGGNIILFGGPARMKIYKLGDNKGGRG